ncbi:hypothetical protein [Serratia plymuthica]|uniref:Uncharacterized protein n=1 Tax=Serratia plymuthica TaxID=82996 RepID=A0A318NS50_SERPL|nr:hypothetical protein [Serratia plymuthica]PYD36574.1 hypothetical protein CT690_23810 [Serratia plymuthica]
MNTDDPLPLLCKFTDENGQQWAFSDDIICYLETDEGDPFWHFYRYHSIDNLTARQCAVLLGVTVVTASVCGPDGQ